MTKQLNSGSPIGQDLNPILYPILVLGHSNNSSQSHGGPISKPKAIKNCHSLKRPTQCLSLNAREMSINFEDNGASVEELKVQND